MTEDEFIQEAIAEGFTKDGAELFLASKPTYIKLEDMEKGDLRIPIIKLRYEGTIL